MLLFATAVAQAAWAWCSSAPAALASAKTEASPASKGPALPRPTSYAEAARRGAVRGSYAEAARRGAALDPTDEAPPGPCPIAPISAAPSNSIAPVQEPAIPAETAVTGNVNIARYGVLPKQSPSDRKQYRILYLTNGMRVVLVSNSHLLEEGESIEAFTHRQRQSKAGSHSRVSGSASGDEDEDEDEDEDYTDEETDDDQDSDDDEDDGEDETDAPRKAAAALRVGVGSFEDPEDLGGLAHFLEHMLFMGSEKYPGEDEFDHFVSDHGGNTNAATDGEETYYAFDIEPAFLGGALDRFANLFIAPLMQPSSTKRELEAIDNEFEMNQQHDGVRREQIFCHLARPDHPAHKFGWGNLKSLKTIPKKKGINTRAALQSFFKTHYSASRMTLVVLGLDELDELEAMVVKSFSPVPTTGQPSAHIRGLPTPWDPKVFHRYYAIPPVNDVNIMGLVWCLESMQDKWAAKPIAFLAELLGHEGKGSILSALKARHWALGLSAGAGSTDYENNSGFCAFEVQITLTDQGLEHQAEVVQLVFEYIALLGAASESELRRFWDECRIVAENGFRFQEEIDEYQFVEDLCTATPAFPDEHILDGDVAYLQFDLPLYRRILAAMNPESVLMFFSSKAESCTSLVTDTEPWFRTPYGSQPIKAEWEATWKAATATAGLDHGLHMPEPNMYVATNFDLHPLPEEPVTEPVLLEETKQSMLWYRPDTVFRLPLAAIRVAIRSPEWFCSATDAAYMNIYLALLEDKLAELVYPASLADLRHKLKGTTDAFLVRVSGLSDRLPLLFKAVIECARTLEVDDEKFAIMAKQVQRARRNMSLAPTSFAAQLRAKMLFYYNNLPSEVVDAVPSCTAQGLRDYLQRCFQMVRFDILVHGNLSADQARDIQSFLESTFATSVTLPKEAVLNQRLTDLPVGLTVMAATNNNQEDVNNALEMYYQIQDKTRKAKVLAQLVNSLLTENAFQVLRTKQQLGYVVHLDWRYSYGYPGWLLTIESQGTNFPTSELVRRVEQFFTDALAYLQQVSPEQFVSVRDALVADKLRPDVNMEALVTRDWAEIEMRGFEFDMYEREATLTSKLTQEEVMEFFSVHLHPSSKTRRMLAVTVEAHKQVAGQDPAAQFADLGALQVVPLSDIFDWRAHQSFLPEVLRAESTEDEADDDEDAWTDDDEA